MRKLRVIIYGRGKLGSTLIERAQDAGVLAELRCGRSEDEAPEDAGLLVLAIPDGAVAERMRALDALYERSIPFVHVAGTLPSRHALPSGRPTGGMHPLISFASHENLPRLRGRTFTLRGDPEAIERARAFVEQLGGQPLVRELSGPRYHAAAAILANGSVALAARAAALLDSLGIEESERNLALAGLVESVSDNLRVLGPIRALTGPIVRGDTQTIEAHLEALDGQMRADYVAIARLILGTARDAGLSAEAHRELLHSLEKATAGERSQTD
ncbi:MAG: DUF2520 domain-containing protein [Sandaracinaceae bacterium]|nr:DUF2520 domain-containing protein [Sandaracinaceae bacterium]